MKASPRILSSPAAPWRSTGRPVTAMRARPWPIPKCFSFQIGWKECARSIAASSGVEIKLTEGPGISLHRYDESLEVDESIVEYEFIRMPDSTGFGDYTETGQVIPASFRGRKGGYSHCMFLNDDPPIAGERELWGLA